MMAGGSPKDQLMAMQTNTNRQKNISRLLREKKKACPDKFKSQQNKWVKTK